MKKYLKYIFLFFILTLLTDAFAQNSEIDKLKNCLADRSSKTAAEHTQNALDCYNLALPLYNSNSILERALYSSALEQYLENSFFPVGGNRSAYNSIAIALFDYFKRFLSDTITHENVKKMTDSELRALSDAVQGVTFYALAVIPDMTPVLKEFLIFGELERRGLARHDHAKTMFQDYLGAGDWDSARLILNRWPAVFEQNLPRTDQSMPIRGDDLGYFTLSADLKTMTLKKLNIAKGPQIIMFGDCHNAEDAIRILGAKADLSEIMLRYGIEIGSTENQDFAKINSLRRQFPAFEIHSIYNQQAWFQMGIDIFEMPSFVFFLDGKVMYKTDDSNFIIQKFCIGLDSIGISRPDSCQM